MVKATNEDLLNTALSLQLLSSEEWDSVKDYSLNHGDADKVFTGALKKMITNQARIELYQELLSCRYFEDGAMREPINKGLDGSIEMHLGSFLCVD